MSGSQKTTKKIGGERQMNKSFLATLLGKPCPRLLTEKSRILMMLPDIKAKVGCYLT